jgi:hypothetical protein
VHLVLDSTGLELFGQGEWCVAKHGRVRRGWLKLQIGVDATTGEIAAHVLTDGHADDAMQVPDLLPAGGCYRQADCGRCLRRRSGLPSRCYRQPGPPPDVIIPPRNSTVPSTADPDCQSPRDQHIQLMADHGRMAWQTLVRQRQEERRRSDHGETQKTDWPEAASPSPSCSGGRSGPRPPGAQPHDPRSQASRRSSELIKTQQG